MILKLMYEKDASRMNVSYEFVNAQNNEIIATATDYVNQYIMLYFKNNNYVFTNIPKLIPKVSVNFKYPLTSKRNKTIGFPIKKNNEKFAFLYREAAKCKKGIFCTNIGFTVFSCLNQIYMLFRVGFKNQYSHYYCLYDNNNTIRAIIERHNYFDDNCKATVYIEDDSYIEIALVACTEELICVPISGDREFSIDTSAGPYISMLEEEKALFDKNFIIKVRAI